MESIMKTRFILLASSLLFSSANVQALTIGGIGGISATADTLVGSFGTFYNYDSATALDIISPAQLAADLTDASESTYVWSSSVGAYVDMAFNGVNVFNGTGNDLVLFFVGFGTGFDLTIDETTNSYGTFDTGFDVTDSFGTYALVAQYVNLDDFFLAPNASLGDFRVRLGSELGYPALSLAGAFNSGSLEVPLPLPAMLFGSGLAMLGLFRRGRAG